MKSIYLFFFVTLSIAFIGFAPFTGKADAIIQQPQDTSKKATGVKITPPTFTPPKVTLPKVAVPAVALPKVAVPQLAVPKVEVPKAAVPKVEVPKVTPPKVAPPKTSLFQKLVDALKFRKNFRAKEKDRIIVIVDSMVLNNDKLATSQSVEDLSAQMTAQNVKDHKELFDLIQKVEGEIPVLPPPAVPPKPMSKADSAAKEQKQLEAILAKILPVIKSVDNNQSLNMGLQKRMQRIRALNNRPPGQIDTLNINDSTALVYKLKLGHTGQVIGIEDSPPSGADQNYNFAVLSAIQFNRYDLNMNDGYCSELKGENTTALAATGRKNGDSVYLSVFAGNGSVSNFLKINSPAQLNFFNSIGKYLRAQKASGLNINFGRIDNTDEENFIGFIKTLSAALKKINANYKLSVTLPAGKAPAASSVKTLSTFADYLLIDFSTPKLDKPGPLVPLSGKNPDNLQVVLSYFLNTGVAPNKFLVAFPYSGIKWSYPAKGGKAFNPEMQPYYEIRKRYDNFFYNADTSVAYATKKENNIIDTVWYDDENTLSKKYDYLLLNKLGGIAIVNLGDDNGFGELWDVATDKFLTIDTVKVKIIHKNSAKLTLAQKLEVYYQLFEYPCDTIFRPNILKLLNIDVTDTKRNIMEYNEYSNQARRFFLILNIVLGILTIGGIITIIYFFRIEGDDWPYRKLVLGLTTVLCMLLVLTLASSAFLDDSIPLFGATDGAGCINMPFHTLMIIISVGMIIGLLLMRFFILPFMKRQDVP